MELRGKIIPFDGQVHVTNDLSIFKITDWNRSIDASRQKKIKKSILEVGYIPTPIIVNEKMEVIDGQGRLAVLRELGNIPVWYIVVPGIGRDECTSMNNSMTNWGPKDFVHSFAVDGNETYIWLEKMLERYDKVISYNVVIACATGLYGSSRVERTIKEGRLELDESDFQVAEEKLEFLNQFREAYSKCTQKPLLQRSLLTAFDDPDCNNAEMVLKLNSEYKIGRYGNINECLESLSDIYNKYKSGKNKIDLRHYNQFVMSEKMPSYEKKWGEAS